MKREILGRGGLVSGGIAMFALGVLGGGLFACEDCRFFFWGSILLLIMGVTAISMWLVGLDPEIWIRKGLD